MARIPLEDNFNDVLSKAQRGLKIADDDLCRRAEITPHQLAALKQGSGDEAMLRRVSPHLRLNSSAMVQLANKSWYPTYPNFPSGFAAFNTPHEDMTVNSYLVWDQRTRLAAVFDTGTNVEPLLDVVAAEQLTVRDIFLTHTHEDHIADLKRLQERTGAQVWSSELEPVNFPGAKTFAENAFFHVGSLSVKTLITSGHSVGSTTYYVGGLSFPLAIVGDAIFASSLGGGHVSFADAYNNVLKKIIKALPVDTVLAPGHGPLTTVAQEKKYNPFFARG